MEQDTTRSWKHRLSDIDLDNKTATCAVCGPFTPLKLRNDGRKSCATRETTYYNSATRSPKHRGSRFGLKPGEALKLYDTQGGKCGLCSESIEFDKSHIDHNHLTGAVRAVLCRNCNTGLGKFKESPELLEKAAAYLRTHT